jgi:hypothetical protein
VAAAAASPPNADPRPARVVGVISIGCRRQRRSAAHPIAGVPGGGRGFCLGPATSRRAPPSGTPATAVVLSVSCQRGVPESRQLRATVLRFTQEGAKVFAVDCNLASIGLEHAAADVSGDIQAAARLGWSMQPPAPV